MSRFLPAALTGGALLWLAAILLAPLALASAAVAFAAVASFVYEAASFVCHQRPDRSFHVAAVQMPVCARCFGLYASGASGAVTAWLAARRGPVTIGSRAARIVLALAAAPTALTLALEWTELWRAGNAARAAAALPLGAAAGWMFVAALLAEARPRFRSEPMRYHA